MAAYIVPKRVERDGVLIAYQGQVMTEAEAEALGILAKPAKEAPPKKTAKK